MFCWKYTSWLSSLCLLSLAPCLPYLLVTSSLAFHYPHRCSFHHIHPNCRLTLSQPPRAELNSVRTSTAQKDWGCGSSARVTVCVTSQPVCVTSQTTLGHTLISEPVKPMWWLIYVCPDIWVNIILGVSVRRFLMISTCIGRLRKQTNLRSVGGYLSTQWRPGQTKKAE